MQEIGHNDGITAMMNRLREKDPAGTIVKKQADGKWPKEPLETIKDVPIENWKAYDKAERALSILVYDHDHATTMPPNPTPVEPPPDPTPAPSGFAPQAYNRGSRGQDARYNVHINCVQQGDEWVDGRGVRYDSGGRALGGRSGDPVDGLKPADMMDNKEPWESYEWQGKTFPPYPAASYRQ